MGVRDKRYLVTFGVYAGLENGEKWNQDSRIPLGNGTTEGRSLGKAVRGTTELCQNAVA